MKNSAETRPLLTALQCTTCKKERQARSRLLPLAYGRIRG